MHPHDASTMSCLLLPSCPSNLRPSHGLQAQYKEAITPLACRQAVVQGQARKSSMMRSKSHCMQHCDLAGMAFTLPQSRKQAPLSGSHHHHQLRLNGDLRTITKLPRCSVVNYFTSAQAFHYPDSCIQVPIFMFSEVYMMQSHTVIL